MKINRKISKYNHTTYNSRKILYLVIHYVGAVSSAANNAAYFAGGNRGASAHYFTDDSSIWQSVEDNNAAWHCGGGLQGKGGHSFYGKCTNANSIGVEMCCKKKDGRLYITDDTITQTEDLVQSLMDKYDIPASRVIRHYDVTGKSCPEPYLKQGKWDHLHETLTGGTVIPKYPTVTLQRGDMGNQVKSLQKCLNKIMKSGLEIDGSLGSATFAAVRAFQKKYNLDVDGSCGPVTRAKIKALM